MSDTIRLWTYIERIRDCRTSAELDWIGRAVVAFRGSSRITAEQYKRLIEHGARKRKEIGRSNTPLTDNRTETYHGGRGTPGGE